MIRDKFNKLWFKYNLNSTYINALNLLIKTKRLTTERHIPL